jgi:hypothetical protein
MFEQNLARIRAHRNNIYRYRRLLRTELSDLERDFHGPRAGRTGCSGRRDIPGDISPCERVFIGFLEQAAAL